MENFITNNDGAFKTVKIYDTFVVKSLKDNSSNSGYNSYTSKYSSCYEEQFQELETEFQFAKKYSRFSVVPKVLFFKENEATLGMEKIHKIGEHTYRPTKVLTYKKDQILKEVKKRARLYRIDISNISHRVESMIEFAIYNKLPKENIIKDLVELLLLDEMTSVLGDMHRDNYGIKGGHIVMVDLGQANLETNNSLHGLRKRKRKNVSKSIFEGLDNETRDSLLKILSAKSEKRTVKLQRRGAKLEITVLKVDKAWYFRNSGLKVYYDKVNHIFIGKDEWQVI